MKYIKTFENIKSYDLKKYFVTEKEVLELVKSSENFKIIVQTLSFSKRTNDVAKSSELEINLNTIKNKIIFQSDDINEIRERLELLEMTNKYNIG